MGAARLGRTAERSARAAESVRALLAADLNDPGGGWADGDEYEEMPAQVPVPTRPPPTRSAVLVRPGAGRIADWLHRRGLRADPGRRGAVAIGCAALVAAAIAGAWLIISRPHSTPIAQITAPAASHQASAPRVAASASAPAAALVIDVVGRVRHPGVYRLAAGSRVDDALRAAGGAVPGVDLSALNLARMLADGEQVAVGVTAANPPPDGATGGGTAGGSSGAAGRPVDLNTAAVAQLDGLPGVGPVLAQRILDWRTAHGRFDSVDQLREVSGIGPAKFASLRPLVTV